MPNKPTGWPPGLLQDDSRKLSDWFASRIDARWVVRQVCAEIERNRMTNKQPDALRLAEILDAYHKRSEDKEAAALLRTQHAELQQWKDAFGQLGTAMDGLQNAIERKNALLKRMVDAWDGPERTLTDCYGVVEAIKQELSQ